MAEQAKRRKKARASASTKERGTRLQSAITLAAVCGVAIFFGYFIGQYAIQLLVGEPTAVPVVQVEQGPAGGTTLGVPIASGSSRSAQPSTGQPAASGPAATGSPAPPAAASSAGGLSTGTGTGTGSSTGTPRPAGTSAPTSTSSAPATGTGASSPATPAASPAVTTENVMHRVQVGGYADRGGAEQLLAELRRAGFSDAFITFNNEYRVQVGSFSSRSGAESVAQTLRQLGYTVHLVPVQ